jgi:membrane protein required for colicin V production
MMSLSILDWVIVFIVLFSVLQAISSGFVREFFAFLGVIAGYLVAAWEYPAVAVFYARFMKSPWPAQIAAFFTVFVVVVLLAGIIGAFVSRMLRGVGLRWFDRLLGAAFGFISGVIVSVVVVMGLAAFAPQWGLAQSRIAPFMLATGRTLVWAAPADFRQRFWDGWKLLRTVPEHIPGRDNRGDSSEHDATP